MMDRQMDKIPEIYCAIEILFDKNTDINSVSEALHQIGIDDFEILMPKCEPITILEMAIVKKEPFWYLDEALTKMFLYVDNCLFDLIEVIKKFHGQARIDIAFYQYGTYPALEFSGKNMKKIRTLEADISIDPY